MQCYSSTSTWLQHLSCDHSGTVVMQNANNANFIHTMFVALRHPCRWQNTNKFCIKVCCFNVQLCLMVSKLINTFLQAIDGKKQQPHHKNGNHVFVPGYMHLHHGRWEVPRLPSLFCLHHMLECWLWEELWVILWTLRDSYLLHDKYPKGISCSEWFGDLQKVTLWQNNYSAKQLSVFHGVDSEAVTEAPICTCLLMCMSTTAGYPYL